MKTTYWFWYGGQIVSSVRLPAGTSERAAREEALKNHKANPTIGLNVFEAPFEREQKIRNAIVKVYPSGN